LPADSLQAGRNPGEIVLGRYEIVRPIARSNATVYEALDPKIGRRVAVKELRVPPDAAPEDAQKLRDTFLWQGVAAARLGHPNIVAVFDAGVEADSSYIVMELLRGATLAERLSERGKLSVDEALQIAAQVLDALEFASQHRVVHRDIKPANLIIESSGAVKVLDFGIARLESDGRVIRKRGLAGTPSYMSPEQAAGRRIDRRSDLFAVGVVLYEMVCGRKPFRGDTVADILREIEHAELRLPADLPAALCRVLTKALQRDPRARYDTAGDMLSDIRELQRGRSYVTEGEGGGIAGHQESPAVAPETRAVASRLRSDLAERSTRRRVWLTASTVLLLCWVLGLVLFALLRSM